MAHHNSQRQVDFGGYEAVVASEALETIHAHELDALVEAFGLPRKTTISDQERQHTGAIVHRASHSSFSAREPDKIEFLDNYRAARPTVEVVVRELGRVKAGWAGEGSVAPSTKVLRDIRSASVCLPQFVKMPEVEIEPDDGSVVLRWMDEAAIASFSLSFHGKSEVIGFLSTTENSTPAWKCRVDAFSVLAVRTSDERIRSLFAK
ncbi:hypothetical protein QD460_25960 [Rhizobium jaguaris]|uniref:hypothetical protein n=1 Tax=Rhizobium jaguaris TaxID=1312183 RepID=UPI0039BFA7E0